MNETAKNKLLAAAARAKWPVRDTAMVYLFVRGQLRHGEIIALNLEDLDVRNSTIHIRGSDERLALDDATRRALRRYLRVRPATEDPALFLSERGKVRMSLVGIEQRFRALFDAAGLERVMSPTGRRPIHLRPDRIRRKGITTMAGAALRELARKAERFVKAKETRGLSPRSLEYYEMHISFFLEWMEANGEEEVTPETIEAHLLSLRKRGLAPRSIDARFRALRTWCNWLVKRRLLAESPVDMVDRPRVPTTRPHQVAPEEFKSLYEAIDGGKWHDYRDRCLLLVMFWSGLRLGELVSLHVSDIDRENRLIFVRQGKGSKDRFVPFHPDLVAEIDEYLAHRPDSWEGPELWLANDGMDGVRGALTEWGVRLMLRRRCKENGLPYRHPHSFRHGYAMALLNGGMMMSALSATMGHSSVKVTEIYAEWVTGPLVREYDAALKRVFAPNK